MDGIECATGVRGTAEAVQADSAAIGRGALRIDLATNNNVRREGERRCVAVRLGMSAGSQRGGETRDGRSMVVSKVTREAEDPSDELNPGQSTSVVVGFSKDGLSHRSEFHSTHVRAD